MGIMKVMSSSSYDRPTTTSFKYETVKGNPDPYNCRIVEHLEKCGHLLVLINYPDCRNYEGNKVLLYKYTKLVEIKRQGSIDPHFSCNMNSISPIARFEPTEEGWRLGTELMEVI